MSKRSGGRNRVCFPCRIKYPGKFTNDAKNYNVTNVCSECAGSLVEIHDSIRVPKRHQAKLWRKLQSELESGTLSIPASSHNELQRHYRIHPEHVAVDRRISVRKRKHDNRERALSLDKRYPGLIDEYIKQQRRLNDFDFNQNNLWLSIIERRDDVPLSAIFEKGCVSYPLQPDVLALQWHVHNSGLLEKQNTPL
jgi:hypothetical protein